MRETSPLSNGTDKPGNRNHADVSNMLGAYRWVLGAARCNSTGGIPPVKCRNLADKACTSGTIWRLDHALVVEHARLVDKSRTSSAKIRASYF